jgi:chromosome segregation ATPase
MEVDRQNLAEAVTLAERKYSEEKKKVDELQQQVKLHRASLESAKQELVDYKQKATRILQVSMSAHSDVPLYGRRQPSTHWGMCWLHCPAAH